MTSNIDFDSNTTGSMVCSVYAESIKGKTILITGISPNSIGAETACALASGNPAKIILASRTKQNIDAVTSIINTRHPSVLVLPLIVNLASQTSVRNAADIVNESIDKLDLFIGNAGIMALPSRTLSDDGIEMQLATNCVGHFLLINLVLGKLREAANGQQSHGCTRVVMVSSNGHRFSPFRFHDHNFEGRAIPKHEEPNAEAMLAMGLGEPTFDVDHYDPFVAYGQSKTASVLLALQLREKLAKDGIQAYSVHPGTIGTNLLRHVSESKYADSTIQHVFQENAKLGVKGYKTTNEGAATTLVAALDPQLGLLRGAQGIYLSDCQLADAAPHATNLEYAANLWALGENLVGEKFEI